MPEPTAIEPLIGDTNRQANDLHKGIVFQIWRSVEAWINLLEDELLYLEGAEDFDVVTKDSGTAFQIKGTAANITLRSESVVDAMVNFWLIRSNNSQKQVRFRFITTSAVGDEKGITFEDGKPGLKVWQECNKKQDLALVTKLQSFLVNDSSISKRLDTKDSEKNDTPSPNLLSFLKTASPQQVLEQLIAPISWEVESVDEDVVKESVGLGLRAYGEHLRYRPEESMVARDRLYRVAAETSKKEDKRVLSRDDLRREFNDATSRQMSFSEIIALETRANAIQQAGLNASTDSSLMMPGISPISLTVPSFPATTIKRPILVDHFASTIKKLGTIIIRGSSGMGKSTIAALAATQVESDWVWVDLQSLPAGNIPQVIRGLAKIFFEKPTLKNLVLDNMNFSASDLSAVQISLPAVLRIAQMRCGTVIITTQRDLPSTVLHKMGLTNANILTMPRLSEGEIEEFCRLLGCPGSDLSRIVAKLVHLQTFGHPRLVHARLFGLQNAGWPKPNAEDLTGQPTEIVEEREIARQLLDNAPSGDKELLYRLSITTGPFRKDHAIAVGKMAPALPFPADSFARLAGPWIDALSDGYYRISPLLHSAATDNWTAEMVSEARRNLAHAMLSARSGFISILAWAKEKAVFFS